MLTRKAAGRVALKIVYTGGKCTLSEGTEWSHVFTQRFPGKPTPVAPSFLPRTKVREASRIDGSDF